MYLKTVMTKHGKTKELLGPSPELTEDQKQREFLLISVRKAVPGEDFIAAPLFTMTVYKKRSRK
jgi:hypothetical protein